MSYIGQVLPVNRGGTGTAVLPTDGQLLIGDTSIDGYVVNSLTAGSGILITPGAGTLTIASNVAPPTLTPVFIARRTSTVSNVTGDGTQYTIIFDTADANVGSAYDTATGVFTPPDTDNYILMFCVETGDIGAAHTLMDLKISTGSGQVAHGFYGNPFVNAVSGRFQVSQCVAMNITASDTVSVSFTVSNGTKIVDVIGAATYETWFAGYRLSGSGGGGSGTLASIVDGSGNTVSPTGGLITLVNGNNVSSISGSASHITLNLTGTTDHLVQIGNASGSITSLSAGTAGTFLQSNGAGADPAFVSVPIISTWTDVTNPTQAMAIRNGYVTDLFGGVTYTLPATASLGDRIQIVGKLGITTIAQNANQQILLSSSSTTVGVTGTCVGTNLGDCITLICITAGTSTVWRASNFVGNWTLT